MANESAGHVVFLVEYEDGRKTTIAIDRHTLGTGEDGAQLVVREFQVKGRIPDGEIKRVTRL